MAIKKRTMLFEQFNHKLVFDAIVESVTGDIKDVQDEVKDVMDELGKEGAEDDEIKAALLMQAIDNDGEIEKVDVEQLKKDVKEGVALRGQPLNEAEGGLIHMVEVAGNLLGNAAFIEFIAEKLEKMTGKKVDPGKIKSTLEKVFGFIKKISGLPAKAISKFFGWVASKFGAKADGKKAAEILSMGALILVLGALGVMHFPVLGSGILWWVLSLTGLVGKSVELAKIFKEIKELIHDSIEKKDDKAKEEMGVAPEELEKIVSA